MNEIIVIILFLLWYIGALMVSENTKKNSKLGSEWLFFVSMVFSPIIGFLLYLGLAKK